MAKAKSSSAAKGAAKTTAKTGATKTPAKAAGKQTKKTASVSIPINDVAQPGTSLPSDTSKAIITHRPIMKDPMVVEDNESADPLAGKSEETALQPKRETKIQPLSDEPAEPAADDTEKDDPKAANDEDDTKADTKTETDDKVEAEKAEKTEKAEPGEAGEPDAADADVDESADEPKDAKGRKSKKPVEDAEAAAHAEEDARLQKLVDSKKYFLPINAVEQRRNARTATAGILLALILIVLWVDIALDAGLIHLGGLKAVTHFFST